MDISSSQYNSGSESGWTHYLDQSSVADQKHLHWRSGVVECDGKGAGTMEEEEEEDEEDLSMVSDASSGPPHAYYHHEEYCQSYCVNWYDPSTSQYNKESEKKNNKVTNQQPSPLDDTASSPLLNYPKKKVSFSSGDGAVESALDYSQCFSASKVKRKGNKFQKHFSLFDGSVGRKQASEEPCDDP